LKNYYLSRGLKILFGKKKINFHSKKKSDIGLNQVEKSKKLLKRNKFLNLIFLMI